jgi:hypothetical protein
MKATFNGHKDVVDLLIAQKNINVHIKDNVTLYTYLKFY